MPGIPRPPSGGRCWRWGGIRVLEDEVSPSWPPSRLRPTGHDTDGNPELAERPLGPQCPGRVELVDRLEPGLELGDPGVGEPDGLGSRGRGRTFVVPRHCLGCPPVIMWHP